MRLVYILLLFSFVNMCYASDDVYHDCTNPNKQTELYSLACNIYEEARSESLAGKFAVGFVTLNRVYSKRFPDTITGVVYQDKQFSWTEGKGLVRDYKSWIDSLQLASILIDIDRREYKYRDITEGSLFYHADYVNPEWVSTEDKVVQIGVHIFYTMDKKK